MTNSESNSAPDAQALLNQIVLDYTKDKRRKRLWRRFYRSIILVGTLLFTYIFYTHAQQEKALMHTPHVGMINLIGPIFEGQGVNADDFAKGLDAAFQSEGLKGVILKINSPGGSPVQADYIYNTIKFYQQKNPDIKFYAVCTDVCASAAYYVAAAADEIYANEASMVGSIGVLYNGFGFVGTMEKLGVARRLMTAGKYKGMLDPFSPTQPEEEQKLQAMLDAVHQQFISKVKEGRGARLVIDDEIFSGLFWTGGEAKTRGLIDGFGSPGFVAREVIKVEDVVDYTYEESVFEKVAKSIGTAMVSVLPEALGLRQGFF